MATSPSLAAFASYRVTMPRAYARASAGERLGRLKLVRPAGGHMWITGTGKHAVQLYVGVDPAAYPAEHLEIARSKITLVLLCSASHTHGCAAKGSSTSGLLVNVTSPVELQTADETITTGGIAVRRS